MVDGAHLVDVSLSAPMFGATRAEDFARMKVAGFLLRDYLYIKILFKERKAPFVRYRLEKGMGWAECRVSMRVVGFPHEDKFNVRSVQVRDPLDRALVGMDWFYETEAVRFRDAEEEAVFGFAVGAFVVLRKAGAIPGRLTKTGFARKAIEWLGQFRAWRDAGFPEGAVAPEPKKEGPDAGDHGDPGREGLPEAGGGEGGGDGGQGQGRTVLDQDRDGGARLQGDGRGDQGRDGRAGTCTSRRRKTGARTASRSSSSKRGTASRR